MGYRASLKRVGWVLCCLCLIALVSHQISNAGDFRIDDAYISFSFAKNLALGKGPVFSHGVRVEGYSNFLWVIATAIGYLIVGTNQDPYFIVRVFEFGLMAVGAWLTYRLARRQASVIVSLGVVTILLSSMDVVRAALSGLETVPYMTAIVFGWWAYAREPATGRRWSLLAFVPAALTRIDGFAPLLVVLAYETASAIVERRLAWSWWWRWALPAVGIWVAYFAWRWQYYGLFLPTTYYAKTQVTLGDPDRGWNQAWEFAREYGGFVVLPWMMVPLLRGERRLPIGLMIATIAQILYVGKVGGDWMPFRRFFLPILPLALVLLAWGIQGTIAACQVRTMEVRVAVALAAACSLFWVTRLVHASFLDSGSERGKQGEADHTLTHTRDNLLAVKDLMQYVVRSKGDKLVTDYAGVFSVFTDAAIIDQWGLCQADIALKGGTQGINPIYGKECASCYADFDADYFHVVVPIVRGPASYHEIGQVIGDVFQGYSIDPYIDLRHNFAVGRVIEQSTNRTLWFLERRRPTRPIATRQPGPGIVVDYPFEGS